MKHFYIDTSIWMDLYEDRKGYNGEPLGDYALKLFRLIMARKDIILISSLLIKELEVRYSMQEINGMIKPFEKLIDKAIASEEQNLEAKKIAKIRDLPFGDVLHAILARDNEFILVSRDNHFRKLKDIVRCHKPEELI